MAPHLSAIIITHNEARRLDGCLESLRGLADEIIVLDDGSTDGTVEIATKRKAIVAEREFDNFGAQKQAALDLATGEWVLSIDSDERVTPELADEVRAALQSPGGAQGFWIRRRLIYLGKELRYGGTGSDWVLRLARREAASFSPKVIHERMLVNGETRRLSAVMYHVKYESLSEHISTIDRYTTIIANEKRAKGVRFHWWHLGRFPVEIWKRLLFQGGILDGSAGFIHAAMAAFYSVLKYLKLWRADDGE
jgi:glycosyltransferase involved in cell wall biosynthesis